MKTMETSILAVLLALSTGCATGANPSSQEGAKAGTVVRFDQYTKDTTVFGPPLRCGQYGMDFLRLAAIRERNEKKWTYCAHFTTHRIRSQGRASYFSAYDDKGTKLTMMNTRSGILPITDGLAEETVAVVFSREQLAAATSLGLKFKLLGHGDSTELFIQPDYVKGFLDKLAMAQSADAPVR